MAESPDDHVYFRGSHDDFRRLALEVRGLAKEEVAARILARCELDRSAAEAERDVLYTPIQVAEFNRICEALAEPDPYELETRPLRFFGRMFRSLFGG